LRYKRKNIAMNSKNQTLLITMKVVAWIAWIGLAVKCGSVLVSYIVSIFNPIAAQDLYRGLDLSAYLQAGFWQYSMVAAYHALMFGIQAYAAFLVAILLGKLNIERPFSDAVAKSLQRISQSVLVLWFVALAHNLHVTALQRYMGIPANPVSIEFIILAGIIYILAHLFKRGIEIQAENDLTV
jgi:hypothetical protein